MILLDGKPVAPTVINPALHKFTGLFRYPNPPEIPKGAIYYCGCGKDLATFDEIRNHWAIGHLDIPVYETIPGPTIALKNADGDGLISIVRDKIISFQPDQPGTTNILFAGDENGLIVAEEYLEVLKKFVGK